MKFAWLEWQEKLNKLSVIRLSKSNHISVLQGSRVVHKGGTMRNTRVLCWNINVTNLHNLSLLFFADTTPYCRVHTGSFLIENAIYEGRLLRHLLSLNCMWFLCRFKNSDSSFPFDS